MKEQMIMNEQTRNQAPQTPSRAQSLSSAASVTPDVLMASLVLALAAGYALEFLFDIAASLRDWSGDEDESHVRRNTRALVAATQFIADRFREKGVTFDEQLRPLLPPVPLDMSQLVSGHGEAVECARQALDGVADAIFRRWPDPDWVVLRFERAIEKFAAGPPDRIRSTKWPDANELDP